MNVEISQTYRRYHLEDIISRSPVADVPNAQSIMDNFTRLSHEIYIGKIDNVPICVWGVIRPSLLGGEGYLWLLVTELADEHKFVLIRHSQREIERLLNIYTALIGECAVEDLRAQRWLKFLGATFATTPSGKTIEFRIEKKHGSGYLNGG